MLSSVKSKSFIKKFIAFAVALIAIVGLYLVFPPLNRVTVEKPVALVPSDNNRGLRCQTNTIYVTEETRETHDKEGYSFVADNNCADLQKNLLTATENDDLSEIRRLISMGANPQTADWSSFEPHFPVHTAIYRNPETLRLLLDNGADVNKEFCCCASCSSPLTTAINENRPETVRLLLERGADVEYRPTFTDGEKYSPLELAIQKGNQEIIDLVSGSCEITLRCRVKSRTQRALRFLHIL